MASGALLLPDEHRADAIALVAPLAAETVPIAEAAGRVAALAVTARVPSPLWDNSAMDGYAVLLADVAGASPVNPVRLAAAAPDPDGGLGRTLTPGVAVAVMTGAPVPEGCEAIVPVEDVRVSADGVVILAEPTADAHVRRRAEDSDVGDLVVAAGDRLGPGHVAALIAVGHGEVVVSRRPRVAIVATGSELVSAGEDLPPRGGYDSNSPMLAAAAREVGAVVVDAGSAPDEPTDFLALVNGLDADLVITTGGVSMGAFDVVKAALAPLGVEFRRLAMQPGKPQGIGRLPSGTPLLALPGNPVSALASFRLFAAPALLAAQGAEPWPVPDQFPAAEGWDSPAGKMQVVPAVVENGAVRRATGSGSKSHLVVALARGRAWALVPADVTRVEPGDELAVLGWMP